MQTNESDIQKIIDLARLLGAARTLDLEETGRKVAVLPKSDGTLELASLKRLEDEWLSAPRRNSGTSVAHTLNSFVSLINRLYSKDDGPGMIFGCFDHEPSLLAVLNYRDGETPRFGDHLVRYAFPLSPEWKTWNSQNGKWMSQTDWGVFIENQIADLVDADQFEKAVHEEMFLSKTATPSEIVSLSRGLSLTVESVIKEVRVLQSGEAEVLFEEKHKDMSGNKLVVPGLFVIAIPLFLGAEKSRFIVRLRYKRADGRLLWSFNLYRPEPVIRDRLIEAIEAASQGTGLAWVEGRP